jgi:hypothetical protein
VLLLDDERRLDVRFLLAIVSLSSLINTKKPNDLEF